MRAKEAVLVAVLVIAVLLVAFMAPHGGRPRVKVLAAGSLSVPLSKLAKEFGDMYGVDVQIEFGGSVKIAREVADLGKRCDALFVADYRVIPSILRSAWYIGFAGNELVLAYTNASRHADELGGEAWYRVLMRRDVRWGLANPNLDPCGYRAVGVLGLASLYYGDPSILGLLTNGTNVSVGRVDGGLVIRVPEDLRAGGRVVVRPKSVDLVALLEAHYLDYAFEYRSVAVQRGLRFVELPPQINLGDDGYSDFYSKVSVVIRSGAEGELPITMSPIIYGVTVPASAGNPGWGARFVCFVLTRGGDVFASAGQGFLERPIVHGDLPREVRGCLNA